MTIKFDLDFLSANATDEDIFEEIRRVDTLVGKNILIKADFDKNSKIHSSTLIRRFGDWQNILEKAGIGHKYSGRSISQKMRLNKAKYLTDKEIIEEIKRVARTLGKDYLTTEDLRANSEIISEAIIRRRFGSWEMGIEKAGLKISEMYHRKFSDEEYFENLLNVWTHYGRQPLGRELSEPPSEISSAGYVNRFGSFRKALEAFVARMNLEEGENEQASNKEIVKTPIREEIKRHSVAVEDRRGMRLGLRYKILSRDRFKCVKCGSSPAIDPSCQLHIDHKVPFSRGGKTILENLQTLCENCNLGKGNRYYE